MEEIGDSAGPPNFGVGKNAGAIVPLLERRDGLTRWKDLIDALVGCGSMPKDGRNGKGCPISTALLLFYTIQPDQPLGSGDIKHILSPGGKASSETEIE